MDDIRSFIAVEVPPAVKSRVEELQRELRRTGADVKWVRPEAIHLTLKFLGTIGREDVERISRAMGPRIAQKESFEVRVRGMGCFPGSRNPRVVWVGVEGGKEDLASLQQAVEEQAAMLSFPPEERAFSAHLTLGRVRSPQGKGSLLQGIESRRDVEVGNFRVTGVILYRSELKPAGAVYTKLKEFPLKEKG